MISLALRDGTGSPNHRFIRSLCANHHLIRIFSVPPKRSCARHGMMPARRRIASPLRPMES